MKMKGIAKILTVATVALMCGVNGASAGLFDTYSPPRSIETLPPSIETKTTREANDLKSVSAITATSSSVTLVNPTGTTATISAPVVQETFDPNEEVGKVIESKYLPRIFEREYAFSDDIRPKDPVVQIDATGTKWKAMWWYEVFRDNTKQHTGGSFTKYANLPNGDTLKIDVKQLIKDGTRTSVFGVGTMSYTTGIVISKPVRYDFFRVYINGVKYADCDLIYSNGGHTTTEYAKRDRTYNYARTNISCTRTETIIPSMKYQNEGIIYTVAGSLAAPTLVTVKK